MRLRKIICIFWVMPVFLIINILTQVGWTQESYGIDVYLLIDQSGSMDKTTDPQRKRIDAAVYLIDYVSDDIDKVTEHYLGIINFGDEAPDQYKIPLTSLRYPQDAERIKNQVQALNLGNTSFIKAFRKAFFDFDEREKIEKGRRHAIILITDGEPDDRRKLTKDAYFNEIQSLVERYDTKQYPVYVLAIDATGSYWTKDKPYWAKIVQNRGKVDFVTSIEKSAIEKKLREFLGDLLHIKAESLVEVTPRKEVAVEIEPYLEKVRFSVFKDTPQIRFQITRQDGQPVDPNKDKDVSFTKSRGGERETYSIIDPKPGTWHYKILEGMGRVVVGRDLLKIEAKLNTPKSPYPQSKMMRIIATFQKRDGRKVTPQGDNPLVMGAKVTCPPPEKKEIDVLFDEAENGLYIGREVIDTSKEGTYSLNLWVKDGIRVISSIERSIVVQPIPYVNIMTPAQNSRLPFRKVLTLRAVVMQKGVTIDPKQVFKDDPRTLVLAFVESDPSGNRSKTQHMNMGTGVGELYYTFDKLNDIGRYIISAKMGGSLRSGEPYPGDSDTLIIYKYRTIQDIIAEQWKWLLVLAVIFGVAKFILWVRRPVLMGQIQAQGPGDDQTIYLSGKKMSVGKGCRVPLNNDDAIKGKRGYLVSRKTRNEQGEIAFIPVFHEQRSWVNSQFIKLLLGAIAILVVIGVAIWAFMYAITFGFSFLFSVSIIYLLYTLYSEYLRPHDKTELSEYQSKDISNYVLTYRL